MFSFNEKVWAQELFGECQLGDVRRTHRLVDMAGRLAREAGASMAKCCRGDPAAQLASYRFLRNDSISAEQIRVGGLDATARQIDASQRLLALEDTTSLSYRHAVSAELGVVGNSSAAKARGYLVHSVLLVDSATERTVGLLEQQHWCRKASEHGKKHTRKQRAYGDKESFKWQQASENVTDRMGPAISQVISVADRESDVYGYLRYKITNSQRFVLRASVDRRTTGASERLFGVLDEHATELGQKTVTIPQRGGRKARQAKLVLRAMPVDLSAPAHAGRQAPPLTVNAVLAEEVDAPEGVTPLRWRLLTSEPIDEGSAVKRVVRDYELRWRIEEYHKAWKSGVGVEQQRLQRATNLERMIVITAFVAVRLLQLREAVGSGSVRDEPPEGAAIEATPFESDEWHILWLSTEKTAPPKEPPSARWTYHALAKLGGFTDTKRTGRPGWATLWSGWFYLQQRLEGYRLSMQMAGKM